MKKYFLFVILFFGVAPCLKHGKLALSTTEKVYADEFGEEDSGDPCDPESTAYDEELCNDIQNPTDPPPDTPPPPPPGCDIEAGQPVTNNYTSGGWDYTSTCVDYTDCMGFDYGEDCTLDSTVTQCLVNSVGLTVSPVTAVSGAYVTLTASPEITGSPVLNYQFQVMDASNAWVDIGNGTAATCNYLLDDDGETDFRVILTGTCSTASNQVISSASINVGTCGVNAVTLQLSQPSGKLGDLINFTANVEKTGEPTLLYTFQACYNNNGNWIDMATLITDHTSSYTVNLLNEIDFRVGVYYTCSDGTSSNTVYSDPVPFVSANCRSDFLTAASSKMSTVWDQAVTSQSVNADQEEFGFALNWDDTQFTYVDETPVSADCNAPKIEIATLSEGPSGSYNPNLGETYTVGNFHTHPTLKLCDPSVTLVQGPSSIDNGVHFLFPAFVGAFNTYSIVGGNPGTYGQKNYPFGIDCCTYP